MLGVGECDVEGERGGSVGTRVRVRVERFGPRLALGGGRCLLVLELEERSVVEDDGLVAADAERDAERRVGHDDVHVGVLRDEDGASLRGAIDVGEFGRCEVVDEDVGDDVPRVIRLVHAQAHDALGAVGRELDAQRGGFTDRGEVGAPSPAARDGLPPPGDRVDLARGALGSIAVAFAEG